MNPHFTARSAATVVLLLGLGTVAGQDARSRRSEGPSALARLAIVDAAIDFRAFVAGAFVPGRSGQPLAQGDTVRTDQTGFGEVDYFEGSVTRLDVSTVFTVNALADSPARRVDVHLEVGRTWNRVQKLAERDRFVFHTPVGIATVRGTTFVVACDRRPACTFLLVEGRLDVESSSGYRTTLHDLQSVTIGPDGSPVGDGPRSVLPQELSADPWVGRNASRDERRAASRPPPPPPGAARFDGTYTMSSTVVEFTENPDAAGAQGRSELDAAPLCPIGGCDTALVTTGRNEVARFDGEVYLVTGASDADCTASQGRTIEGAYHGERVVSFVPTKAEVVDGRWVATELAGSSRDAYELTDAGRSAGCPPGGVLRIDSTLVRTAPSDGVAGESVQVVVTPAPVPAAATKTAAPRRTRSADAGNDATSHEPTSQDTEIVIIQQGGQCYPCYDSGGQGAHPATDPPPTDPPQDDTPVL